MFRIERLSALEILDSRGRPTVQAACGLAGGHHACAAVPSGASTGKFEALELRDGDPKRFRGFGCRRAVSNIHQTLRPALVGGAVPDQSALDQALIQLDGTRNKSRLGANALLAVSLAFARAAAQQRQIPLHDYFADLAQLRHRSSPQPIINLFSGAKHAGGQCPIQDVLIAPLPAQPLADTLAIAFEIYQCAAELIAKKYGMRLLRADEGGLAPPFPNAQAMIEDALEAIAAAGLVPGKDVALAVDAAATHFYDGAQYRFGPDTLDSPAMTARWAAWTRAYPIISLEDGLAEEDWEHWPQLRAQLAGSAAVVGDDLLCTNPDRIARAIRLRAADTLLLKVNQIGTVTEAAQALRLARGAGWRVTVSARSGETEDNWLADLAVGWAADHIKIGSITQSDRLSKYNRLLAIESAAACP